MGDSGIKIAKATKNVSSSTPADFHFWSKYKAKSVKYKGSLQVTSDSNPNSPVTNSYTHNYGYLPQFMDFVTSYDGGYVNCDYFSGDDYGKEGDLWNEFLSAHVTTTQIVVSADLYYFTPNLGGGVGIVRTYTFDILLFMEEVETS